jgi:hypothetical protein
MKTTNLNEAIRPILDKLEMNECEFEYDENSNMLISKNTLTIPDDLQEYFVVIKLNDTKTEGEVLTGTSDGVEFYEYLSLGNIAFENDKWILK